MSNFIENLAKQLGAKVIGGNCEVLATESDYDADNKCCKYSTEQGTCVIEINHVGTPHRICRYRKDHLGPCSYKCFWDTQQGD